MSTERDALRGVASRLGPDLVGYGVSLSLIADADAQAVADAPAATASDAFRWTFVARDAEAVRNQIAWYEESRRLIYVVRVDGEVVGQTGFYDLEYWSDRENPDVVEVGHTWYLPAMRGTAVNPACKLLLFTHAFETWGVARIGMRTDARNVTSRAAMVKLGMTYEGVRRRHMMGADGSPRDSAYFSAVAAEWPAIKTGLRGRLS